MRVFLYFVQVFVISNGFSGWTSSKLQTKFSSSVSTTSPSHSLGGMWDLTATSSYDLCTMIGLFNNSVLSIIGLISGGAFTHFWHTEGHCAARHEAGHYLFPVLTNEH